ncbi:hypothetical protein PS15m_006141 [Mucor circinelloides]
MLQNGHQDVVGPVDKVFEVDQLQAMRWAREAWKAVSEEIINCWNSTIFRLIYGEDSPGVEQAILNQRLDEMSATDNLRETLTSITNTGLISIEDCPTEELDPVFERENVHRVVREEEIVDIVLEETDSVEKNEDDEHEMEDEFVRKTEYTASKKLDYLTKVLDILDDEKGVAENVVEYLENLRAKYHRASFSKQTKVTQFFKPKDT